MAISNKIKQYRLNKNLSLQQLANLAGLSKPTIQQYEDGLITPSNKSLKAVAEALKVDIWNFFESEEMNLELSEFRHGEKLLDSDEEKRKIYDLVVDYSQNYLELENILNTEVEFDNPVADLLIKTYQDVEKAVLKIRKRWKLANIAIDDICTLLESKGFKIITFDRQTESPGICGFMKSGHRNIPVIILNTNHEHTREITRKRFTLMHESAHLILKFCESVSKEFEEKLCNRFASAFLMPVEALMDYLGKDRTNISLEELKDLKETYGMSVQAIIYRANSTGLINDQVCTRWIELYEQWRGESKEFGCYNKSKEEPLRFNRLVTRGYMEKRISKEKVSEILDLSMEDIDRRFGINKLSLF